MSWLARQAHLRPPRIHHVAGLATYVDGNTGCVPPPAVSVVCGPCEAVRRLAADVAVGLVLEVQRLPRRCHWEGGTGLDFLASLRQQPWSRSDENGAQEVSCGVQKDVKQLRVFPLRPASALRYSSLLYIARIQTLLSKLIPMDALRRRHVYLQD